MSPKKHSTESRRQLRVDLRIPFAVAVAEALLLMGLLAILIHLEAPSLPLIASGLLIFYLITAGAVLLAFALRYAEWKRAEQEAEELNTDIYRMFRAVTDIPYAVVNADGTVRISPSGTYIIMR
jgi:hypothetical protein